jgi:hypothetical protein
MLTVEMAKCRFCGATLAGEAAVCTSCGTKLRRSAAKSGRGKSKVAPFGLNSTALLEKIDALDWDPTTTMGGPTPATPKSPAPNWRFLVAPVLVGLAILIGGAAALLLFAGTPGAPAGKEAVGVEPSATAAAAPEPAVVPTAASQAAEALPTPSDETREAERAAERDKVLRSAEDAAQRRADRKRKVLAEQQAREEQERQRWAEEERQRLEREAAEARGRAAAAAAPAARVPASPRELCANEGGFFARNACEARACDQPEWRRQAFCVKRWQDEMHKLSPMDNR